MSRRFIFVPSSLTLAAAALLSSSLAAAQTAPSAGQLQQNLEQRALQAPPSQNLELTLPDQAEAPIQTGGPQLHVSRFVLEGNHAISSDELLPLLADLQDRSVTLGELQAGAARLAQRYRERGYPLTRALVPAQEISNGVLHITVLEGRYGAVQAERVEGVRANGAALAPLKVLQTGEVVDAAELERSLLLLQDMPGQQISATLKPGQEVGSSDLVVQVRPGPRLSGGVDVDNYGNRFTGALRAQGYLNVNGPAGIGDRLALRVLASEENQQYYRVGYDLPVNRWGTRIGAGYSYMSYELGETFASLDAQGTAKVASVFARHPLLLNRNWRIDARLQYDGKRLRDEVGIAESISKKRSNVYSLALEGSGRDSLLGGGVSQFMVQWSHGRLKLRTAADQALDASTARTEGSFNVLQATLARHQRLIGKWSAYARVQGQYADGNLDSSEKLGLGGAYGVRAYPQGEAVGDQGWLGAVELRYALTPQWQLQTFVDHGEMRLNKKTWDSGNNDRSLSGAGLGMSWANQAWSLSATLAWKLGSAEPQSDRDRSPRFWVQGGWRF